MFVVSNSALPGLKPENGFWTAHDAGSVPAGQTTLLFDGHLSRPHEFARHFQLGHPAQRFRRFTGQYCGVLLDPAGASVHGFTDPLGIGGDLFLWRSGQEFALASDLAELLRRIPRPDLDPEAVEDFLAIEFPLGGRTFARSVTRVHPGSLVHATAAGTTCQRYRPYGAVPATGLGFDQAVDAMSELLRQAMHRIALRYGPGARYCLGLSGGLDSRIVASLALAEGLDTHAYFFGEPDAHAAAIARRLALALDLPLQSPGRNREFPLLFARSAALFPMANLEWCKYATGRETLPAFDVLLSGRRGDHLFLRGPAEFLAPGFEERAGVADFSRWLARNLMSPEQEPGVTRRLGAELRQIPGSWLQRRQAIGFHRLHSSWQDCGFFRDFEGRPHASPFDDLDVVDHALSLDPRWHADGRFNRALLERHFPEVAESRIPRDEPGRNDNKPVERWLLRNTDFLTAVAQLVPDPAHPLTGAGTQTFHQAARDIADGRCSRNEIHAFFRRLTVESFRHHYL